MATFTATNHPFAEYTGDRVDSVRSKISSGRHRIEKDHGSVHEHLSGISFYGITLDQIVIVSTMFCGATQL